MSMIARMLVGAAVGGVTGYGVTEGVFAGAGQLFAKRLRDGLKDGTVYRVYEKDNYLKMVEANVDVGGKTLGQVNYTECEVLEIELNGYISVRFAYPKKIIPDDHQKSVMYAAKSLIKSEHIGFTDDKITKVTKIVKWTEDGTGGELPAGAEAANEIIGGELKKAEDALSAATSAPQPEISGDDITKQIMEKGPLVVGVKGVPTTEGPGKANVKLS